MKKEEIYVKIDSEEKRLRAIEILENAGERIPENVSKHIDSNFCFLSFLECWIVANYNFGNKTEITLDELEQLLEPNYVVKDVVLTLDELKAQTEKLGYDLIEKPYEPQIGDFGVFWDYGDGDGEDDFICGFLKEIDNSSMPFNSSGLMLYKNFRKLTDDEKAKIQERW